MSALDFKKTMRSGWRLCTECGRKQAHWRMALIGYPILEENGKESALCGACRDRTVEIWRSL